MPCGDVLLFVCFITGSPFKLHYWLAQCGVYLMVMFMAKLIVGPLILFDFWKEVSLQYGEDVWGNTVDNKKI